MLVHTRIHMFVGIFTHISMHIQVCMCMNVSNTTDITTNTDYQHYRQISYFAPSQVATLCTLVIGDRK